MIYRYLVFAVLIMLFGCGGMTSDQEDPAVKSSYPQVLQENKIPVQVLKVVNKTGKEKYDSLCNYLHIKTAQTLGDTDRYAVVSDDLIASSSQQGLSITDSEPEAAILVEITKVLEYNGGTFRFAIFSTQQKRAEVVFKGEKKNRLKVTLRLNEQVRAQVLKVHGEYLLLSIGMQCCVERKYGN